MTESICMGDIMPTNECGRCEKCEDQKLTADEFNVSAYGIHYVKLSGEDIKKAVQLVDNDKAGREDEK